jgi:23S rRNA (guanosine2251-2'-O)-methyltransferase
MRTIILIAHNLRSCHNVGSLLRTAEGIGVSTVYLSGYTPYPGLVNDTRLPHEAEKTTRQITKTSLGAEKTQPWHHAPDVITLITMLKQAPQSNSLATFAPTEKVVLVVGREVEGLENEVMAVCDNLVEIPMYGQKESFNVVQAAAMALYHCRFMAL